MTAGHHGRGRLAAAVLLLATGLSACRDPAEPPNAESPSAESPSAEAAEVWGSWAVLSADLSADVSRAGSAWGGEWDGPLVWTRHRLAASRLAAGGALTVDELERLRPSLLLELVLEPTDRSTPEAGTTPTRFETLVVCGGTARYAAGTIDPATVGPDGTVAHRGPGLQWEARLDGSERIRGTWSAGDCGGRWDGGDAGSDPVDGSWTWFVAEPELASPRYPVQAWGVELDVVGRRTDGGLSLCLHVEVEGAAGLEEWLERRFRRGGVGPGDAVLACRSARTAHLTVDGAVDRQVVGNYLSGYTVVYEVVVTVQGTATLSTEGREPLTQSFSGSRRASVLAEDYDDPEVEARFDRQALVCGLAPVFARWWGTDGSYPIPVVHPFIDPPPCSDVEP